MELSVSLLNSNDKIESVKKLNNSIINYFHIDIMDGKFVSQVSLSLEEVESISNVSAKKLDVHLMVEDPLPYIRHLKKLTNIEYITIHLEIDKKIDEILKYLKANHIKAGLSIKPNTDIQKIKPYLDDISLVLLMTVEPGLGGQPFINKSVDRLQELKSLIKDHNIKIEVDGGINDQTIKKVALADIAVVGSFITKSSNPLEQIDRLLV